MNTDKIVPISEFLNKYYKISLVIVTISLFISGWEYYSYTHLPVDYDPENSLLPVDLVSLFLAPVHFTIKILLLVNFLRFVYWLNHDLREKFHQTLEYTPSWAVWYFFIPILSLFRPYQVVKEISKKIFPDSKDIDSNLLHWWFWWIFSNIVGGVVFRYVLKNMSQTGYDYKLTIMNLIADIGDIILTLYEMALVLNLAKGYKEKFLYQPLDVIIEGDEPRMLA